MNMTAREFLDQYRDADRIARRLKAEYEKELIQIDAVKSVSDMDGMPHGNGIKKTVEDKAVRLADKAAAWKIAELDAIRIRQRVFDTIYNVPDIEGDILYERYINLLTWKEVCTAVSMSWPSVRSHHIKALRIVEGRIQKQQHITSKV
jgi:DNA-directed RNA polymerase specialized sigma24 family protein